jgi:TRAP transporter 4TM/12TM fusion protein
MKSQDLIEKIEHGGREPGEWSQKLIIFLATLWSLFQLAAAELILFDSVTVRCVHLAFALFLLFLSYPAWKSKTIPWYDWILALLASSSALYLALNFEAISTRQGLPTLMDQLVGFTLISLLLEGARRSLGPALPSISFLFILSCIFASNLPAFIASKDVSIGHLLSKLTLSTEGVYGIPLRISADTIFLFVLFGSLLERSGGGQYFVNLAYSLLGRYRGGPAKAAVLASGLTGMVSGSSIANTVTTGTFTIPLMKKAGYPAEKAGAIEVAASTNGQLMPPIMGAAAFIMAEFCHLEYIEVVRAAIVPALLSYIALIYITHLEALKLNMKAVDSALLPQFRKELLKGLHFMIPLAFLIYLLVVERQSPARSVYYAIIVLAITDTLYMLFSAYKNGTALIDALRNSAIVLWESLANGAKNMMSISVAVATAGIIVGVVTLGLGGKLTEIIDVLSGGYLIPLLFITALISLILGMGLPTTANYIVMANLTAPSIVYLSAEAGAPIPIIAAHLFCFYFGILADDTPPVGLAAYAASAIAKSKPLATAVQGFIYDMRTAILPFMFVFNLKLLLIGVNTYFEILWVFLSGLLGLLAFASLTQNYLLVKNKLLESVVLAVLVLAFFQGSFSVQTAAFLVYAGLYVVQWRRKKTS